MPVASVAKKAQDIKLCVCPVLGKENKWIVDKVLPNVSKNLPLFVNYSAVSLPSYTYACKDIVSTCLSVPVFLAITTPISIHLSICHLWIYVFMYVYLSFIIYLSSSLIISLSSIYLLSIIYYSNVSIIFINSSIFYLIYLSLSSLLRPPWNTRSYSKPVNEL